MPSAHLLSVSLLFANNDIPHFLRIIIFFPALSPQSAETSAPFTQNIYKIRAGEEKEERNRIFFGSVRPPLWCLLPLKKHFLTDSEDGLPVGRSQKEAVRNNPVKLVGTQSQEFFFSFCGRKSNRTRGDGARRERTHQSRFMVFSTSRTTDPISLPVHTDFGGHFHSNERQICEKYWRICQSNFEFFKKHFSFILQQVLPPKCARRLNSQQVGQRLSGKKIFAGHFGRKNGDAYQLPWQPEDDEMLSVVEN